MRLPNSLRPLVSLLSMFALWPSGASAAIGDPCDENGVCPLGFFCFPEADTPGYCTGSCPEAGCPEGFNCRTGGGPRELCLKGEGLPPGGGLGEACAGADGCEPPLTCFTDNAGQYCSQYCTVPGSCPAGYRCQPGEAPACSRLVTAPAGLEPCAEGACAAGWDCIEHPSRTLPLCSFPCPAGLCDGGLECVDGHCLPNPWPGTPKFGEPCVTEGLEAKVVGCEGEDFCLGSGPTSYCSRACDIDAPCPTGYGCQTIEPGRPECRRGLPNDEYYVPMVFPDGGFPDPPDASPPPMQAVEQEGGSPSEKSSGCAVVPGREVHRPSAVGGLVVALGGLGLGLWRPRRRRVTQPILAGRGRVVPGRTRDPA